MVRDGMGRWWGPVFEAERVTRARRWQGYALRSLFVLALLIGVILTGRRATAAAGLVTIRDLAQVGSAVYTTFTVLELVAALLIAPAMTAGAICLEKGNGSLAHLFVTDLTDREIILGKLAARLLPAWGLLACAFPVAALANWLGGIDPVALARSFLVVLSVAYLGCAVALMLSVWASRPQEVISVVYTGWAIWLLDWPAYGIVLRARRPPALIEWTHPFFLTLGHYNYPTESFDVPAIAFSLACLAAGTGCVLVAIRRVRAVGCRSPRPRAEPARRGGWAQPSWREPAWLAARRRGRRGPDLDADPVLWREWHRNEPSAWSRRTWLAFRALSASIGAYLIAEAVLDPTSRTEAAGVLLGALTIFGLLLLSAETAGILAEERARGSLDVLLAAPVSTRSILAAKWRGAFRRVPRLTRWPLTVGLIYLAARSRDHLANPALVAVVPLVILAQGAVLVSLGLALATWIRRPGQATAWTVAALVAAVIGWIILGTTVPLHPASGAGRVPGSFPHALRESALYMGSPFWNVGFSMHLATGAATGPAEHRGATLVLLLLWTLIYGLAAWGLFEATAATFDRCLGRAPERPRPPRLAPGAGRSGEASPALAR